MNTLRTDHQLATRRAEQAHASSLDDLAAAWSVVAELTHRHLAGCPGDPTLAGSLHDAVGGYSADCWASDPQIGR